MVLAEMVDHSTKSPQIWIKNLLNHAQRLCEDGNMNEIEAFLREMGDFLISLEANFEKVVTNRDSKKFIERIFQFSKNLIRDCKPDPDIEFKDEFDLKIETDDFNHVKSENDLEVDAVIDEENSIPSPLEKSYDDTIDESKVTESNLKPGYRDSFPISKEEYDSILKKGLPYICPKCHKPCKRRTMFDLHLLRMCHGIPMIWPKWRKVGKQFFCLITECPSQKDPLDGYKGMKV